MTHVDFQQEHKLTPYQTELLSSFDNGPRRIEVDLVARIVAEEDEATAIRKQNKIKNLTKQAWGVHVGHPETVSSVDDNRSKHKTQSEDDLVSMCTSMSFSTANMSNFQEDIFDIEVEDNVDREPEQKTASNNNNKSKKRLSRTKSHVNRNREKHFHEEEERKKPKIRTKAVVKKEKSEVEIKQQIWLHLVAHFARASKMQQYLTKYRAQSLQIHQRKMERRAIMRILVWYRDYTLRRKMQQNSHLLAKIRVRIAMLVRRRRVQTRRDAATMLTHFIFCVNGSSLRTQKLYRFRARVIKIQTVFGQFYKCQRARLQLLYLAFLRELHQARLDRNQVKTNRERISMRSMKRTPFFSDAVQKLDDICSNLTTMIARRNVINNLKMKQLRQLQNETERQRSNSYHILGSKGPPQSTNRRQYDYILKRVLGNQRKRHILSQKGVDDRAHISIKAHQAVDPTDVREFLKTPGHEGPTYVVLDHRDIEEKSKHSPLILLTGGAIRELRDIARGIVANEDEETMNYEIQKTLLRESGQDDEEE